MENFSVLASHRSPREPIPPMSGKSQVEKYRREERRHRDIIDGIRLKIEAKTKRLTDAFRKFDENSDGEVSYSEFRAGLFNLGAID